MLKVKFSSQKSIFTNTYKGVNKFLRQNFTNSQSDDNQQIRVYTDGSLKEETDGKKKLGYGIYWENNIYPPTVGRIRIGKCPQTENLSYSSTLGEMGGIFKSMEILSSTKNNRGKTLLIYTDSQSSIDLIHKILSKNPKIESPIEKTFELKIQNTFNLLRQKGIGFSLQKVKSHCGIIGNEISDYLSNVGRNLGFTSKCILNQITSESFHV